MKLLLILFAFSSVSIAAEPEYLITDPDKKTVQYDGEIVRGSHQALLKHLKPETEKLRMNSLGGNVEEAILMAKEIRTRNIQLVVEAACLSSCANYLFLGASSKVLGAHALLGFHGSTKGQLSTETIASFESGKLKSTDITGNRFEDYLTRVGISELEFLQSINVDGDLFKEIDSKLKPVILEEKRTPKKSGSIILITSDKQWEYQIDDIDIAQEKAIELGKSGIKVEMKMEMQIESPASNLAYFPNRETLEKHGVKGILSYAYPKDASELKQRVLDSFGTEVNIFGDF
ncbi:hypothetical protein ACO0LC_20150 [Undibacterium sp. JH2W]|uniref:hypothetical protein n=1 Tax=Undibacterium sp. JH2W TaxID=3413037 RepID=UPI003BF02F4C